MLFTNEYSIKMPISEALAVSFIGISTVILILAVIAVLIILVSKTIRLLEKKTSEKALQKQSPITQGEKITQSEKVSQGEVELFETDEKTAAVIMAVVSEKTGIPLNRLQFKSIRCTGESEKEADKK